jgi:hypothetical protein
MRKYIFILALAVVHSCQQPDEQKEAPISFSGVYPHLAYYNNEGECGTGAVVPWQDRLWVITYGPHKPMGSSDKLYEISSDLQHMTIRDESIGGTPANRMIHKESNQLFIGPYAIDEKRKVRTIPYALAPGRHTGTARHLTDPKNYVYYGTMEEGFYEVNVRNLQVNNLYRDNNQLPDSANTNAPYADLYGAHGKGLYSGQGVLVYSNNGEKGQMALEKFDIESGSLSEWDGKDWKLVRRAQFVEVTGPGGISGNPNPETDPIWATGWDHKSVLLGMRDQDKWTFFRLPKASHSYDGAHGWNTEWPRIRDVGTKQDPDYLMTMHGMFWRFPQSFSLQYTAGIRPRSAYLKVIGDFARWQDRLVFGCDDSAQKEFLNKRSVKGNIEGPGQSNSNLWFTPLELPDKLGPSTASGAVWLRDTVAGGQVSEPFLFAGWRHRNVWIKNEGAEAVNFIFEMDDDGGSQWQPFDTLMVAANSSLSHYFLPETAGEWVRVINDKPTVATVHFSYDDDSKNRWQASEIFSGIANTNETAIGGLLYGLGDNRRALGIAATTFADGAVTENGYYELDEKMQLVKKEDHETENFIREKFAIPEQVISIENSSVLVVDDKGRRWRLPLGNQNFTELTNQGVLRLDREVATERDLFNCHGTFYELPAENADGFAKIRPVASHNFRVHDYASYRGMLIMTGINPEAGDDNGHIIVSEDGKAAIWAGVIDDLWKLGKAVGEGGPWKDSEVKAGVPSDPYLFGFYEKRELMISHQSDEPVSFTIEMEPIGHGPWMDYQEVTVQPGESFRYEFPEGLEARWIRFVSDKNTKATAWLEYR